MADLKRRNGGPAGLAALVAVILLGLGLRVGWALDQPSDPPPDAVAYERLAENLHDGDGFDARPPGAGREVQPSSSYAPGLPLLVAGLYFLSGGPDLDFALFVLALIGAAAVPLSYLLGRRLQVALSSFRDREGRPEACAGGLLAAAVVAIYPALLQYQGVLLTEPLAATLLIGSLAALFAAADRPSVPRWATTGALLGLLALVRPEYLAIAVILPLTWAGREAWRSRMRSAWLPLLVSLLATAVVLAPWTIRNLVELDRFVPVSTGGGKALYIGTYVEADGDGPQLRELLLDQRPALRTRLEAEGPVDDPDRYVLERVLAKVATEAYPGLETDEALGRLGRENLGDAFAQEPLRFAGMLVEKGYSTWTDTARAVMARQPWRTLQWAVVILSLVGLVALGVRRRFGFVPAAVVLAYMTTVGALLIASPRRELVVLPLLAALAGSGATALADSLARWRS